MKIEELDFPYPDHLIATEPKRPSRIMCVRPEGRPEELAGADALWAEFQPGDALVVNDTRVLRRRVFTETGLEILFLADLAGRRRWSVLCPSSRWKEGFEQVLPGGVRLRLVERGRTQIVEASEALPESYFEEHGEMPLPPYIQKARGERHNRAGDSEVYQTAWAREDGSLAAPTASLHFSNEELAALERRGVRVVHMTLHVGLGTFLPVTAATLDEHVMHAELVEIKAEAWRVINETKMRGGHVWALGTTVARSLESAAHGRIPADGDGGLSGPTDLFIRPGFEWRVVDRLLTNFHQPRSTLLALVAAFAGLENVRRAYQWAIEREFRLFSYGDLSVWIK